MKKSELKNIIKECVKEILFEDGVLSNLVAEVAFGITKAQQQILESSHESEKLQTNQVSAQQFKQEQQERKRKQLLETKRKMLDAIGSDKLSGVFEGTQPLPASSGAPAHSPLSGQSPSDAGVDISGLFGINGQRWKQLK
mgnify:CR=1 FL=1